VGRLRAVDGGKGRLLTVRDVARLLGVSTATVYRLCEEGRLAHVRVGNAIRVRPADLEAFMGRGRP
jgi:excisionase family DNA binding protein